MPSRPRSQPRSAAMSSDATRQALTRGEAVAISSVRTRPAALSIFGISSVEPISQPRRRSCPPTASPRARTCWGVSHFGKAMTSAPASMAAAKSRGPSAVSRGLMRTAARRPAAFQAASTPERASRASGRRSGAVKSSNSAIRASAPEAMLASRLSRASPAGTNSQHRHRLLARACPLMVRLPLFVLSFQRSLTSWRG